MTSSSPSSKNQKSTFHRTSGLPNTSRIFLLPHRYSSYTANIFQCLNDWSEWASSTRSIENGGYDARHFLAADEHSNSYPETFSSRSGLLRSYLSGPSHSCGSWLTPDQVLLEFSWIKLWRVCNYNGVTFLKLNLTVLNEVDLLACYLIF